MRRERITNVAANLTQDSRMQNVMPTEEYGSLGIEEWDSLLSGIVLWGAKDEAVSREFCSGMGPTVSTPSPASPVSFIVTAAACAA